MRRLILSFVAACAIAAPAASAAPDSAKNDSGVTCVLHANLAAESDTGSTSMAKGHTLIKVLGDGTIEFKTEINNDGETFVAAHIHRGAVGVDGPPRRAAFRRAADECERDHPERRGDATRGRDRRRNLCRPERLLRQLPLNGVPGRRDPRPAVLVAEARRGGHRLAPSTHHLHAPDQTLNLADLPSVGGCATFPTA
jgi:hypothetical protein